MPFSFEQAHSVVERILTEELDGKYWAGNISSHMLDLVVESVAALDPAACSGLQDNAFSFVGNQWGSIRRQPRLLESCLQPSTLQSSAWLNAVCAIIEAFRTLFGSGDNILSKGGFLVSAALRGTALGPSTTDDGTTSPKPLTQEETARLIELMEWWGDEVCGKRLGVKEPWGLTPGDLWARTTPLRSIATEGLTHFLPLALSKGCDVNEGFGGRAMDTAASVALKYGHLDVLEGFLAHGLDLFRPYDKDGWPLCMRLFYLGSGNAPFLAELLKRYPGIVNAEAREDAGGANLIGAAIFSKDPALVDLVLSAGARVECRAGESARWKGSMVPSIVFAMSVADPAIMRLMLTKGKALEGWRDKYDKAGLEWIGSSLIPLATSAYPSSPNYDPRAMECLEMVLETGVVCPWSDSGPKRHCPLDKLYPPSYTATRPGRSCVLQEKDALALLKRLHRAGFNVIYGTTEPLQVVAASAGHNEVLEWCVTVLGASAEPPPENQISVLLSALTDHNVTGALWLLQKHKVRAAYPERTLASQPVIGLFSAIHKYSDAEAARVLEALIERDRSLFDLPCYSEESIAKEEKDEERGVLFWNPCYAFACEGFSRALELLLTKDLPGVAAMANRPVLIKYRCVAAQLAAARKKWDCLGLLLRYTDARVTDRFEIRALTAAELVRRHIGAADGPPRTLVSIVEARAKKELADKAKTAAASQAAGAVTNAFEDPPAKPVSEREEKKKAKKKAAKKKAKAKKRAAANAGAGATRPADSSDDDDDDEGEGEVEPDDNLVDSHNAPSLDLMLEQMGLKGKDGAGGAGSAAAPR